MKVKVSKGELRECIENAVRRALTERCEAPNGKKMHNAKQNKKEKYPNKWEDQEDEKINEAWYDDDEDDVLDRFLKDPKNDPKGGKKRMKGGGAAKKAAMADIDAELKASQKDDDAIEAAEKRDRASED